MEPMLATLRGTLFAMSLAVLTVGASASAPAATARENFAWYCSQCHGPNGKGDGVNASVRELPVGPMDLTKAKQMKKFSGADIVKTLTHGGPVNSLDPLMPPWGNTLSEGEIKELMRYVRSLCKDPACPKD